MTRVRLSACRQFIVNGFGDGFAAPVAILAVLCLAILRGIWLMPGGYDGSRGVTGFLVILLAMWSAGMLLRCERPQARIGSGLAALGLYLGISFFASLASAANAIGGGEYIDPWLAQIDHVLFPFYDGKAVALALPDYPWLYRLLNLSYNSFGWQPVIFILTAAAVGRIKDLASFVTAWGLGLLMCVLPFHWLPARSAFPYYGIAQHQMPDHMTTLPWEFLPVLEGVRDGTIRAISADCISGIVSMPSFHAGGAVILTSAFWRFRLLRWPFALLNLLVALSAIPIGSHYVIDVVAGLAVGLLAVAGATALSRSSRPAAQAVTLRAPNAIRPVGSTIVACPQAA